MKKILMGIIVVVLFAYGSVKANEKESKHGRLLDGFETNDWMPSNADGTSVRTSLVPGVDGRALKFDYDLKETGQWVQISKEIAIASYSGKALQMSYKVSGKKVNNLEIKVEDSDGSVYGYKMTANPTKNWEKLTVHLADLTYFWGGDPKLGQIQRIWFAISADEGGAGQIFLDDLRLVKSSKKKARRIKSGLLDHCDTLSGWEIEKEEGAKAKLVSVTGKKKKAIAVEYDLGTGNWVQFYKHIPMVLKDESVIKFYLKWTGQQNDLEFKIVDEDGSTFGTRFELEKKREWQLIKVPVAELTYWWGGDDELDHKNIKGIWFAVSKAQGGSGKISIDHLVLSK